MRISTSIWTIATILVASPALAQSPLVGQDNPTSAAANANAAQNYWTPQRMLNAKPRDAVSGQTAQPSAAMPHSVPSDGTAQQSGEGRPPVVPKNQLPTPIRPNSALTPAQIEGRYGSEAAAAAPSSTDEYGLAFTTSQVEPVAAQTSFPYQTVGKIFYTDPGVGDFYCTGSTIKPNIVLTAGHCV